MKKHKVIISFIILAIIIAITPAVNAASPSGEVVKYVNCTLWDINPTEFNWYARGGTTDRGRDGGLTLETMASDAGHDGWANRDFGTGNNGQYCAVMGIVKEQLSGNTVQYNYPNFNGISLFPTDSLFNSYRNIYPTRYQNYQFPFYKNSSGFYEFDSNTHCVQVDNANRRFNLYTGTNNGYSGFFPFNNVWDDLGPDGNRNYNFSGYFEIPMYLTNDGYMRLNGQRIPLQFNFRGDDDVWVFIDNTLILDMGGCHGAVSGSMNFATKVAEVSQGATSNGGVYLPYRRDISFVGPGNHTIKIFYCERATGESNFRATFNVMPSNLIARYVDATNGYELDRTVQTGYVGDVFYTEQKAFTGYTLTQAPNTNQYTLGENDITVTYYYTPIQGNVTINKTLEATDSSVLQNLAGARFKIVNTSYPDKIRASKNPGSTFYATTDAQGKATFTGLYYGTYTIVEDIVPSVAYAGQFYINNNTNRATTFDISVTGNTTYTYNLKDVAKKMQITIVKEDAETGKVTQGDAHLEGAQYTIYRDSALSNPVQTLTIAKNADGTYSATSGWYLVGTYYVKETKAPEGYNIDTTVYTVAQDPASQTTETTVHSRTSKEKVIRNDVEITKYLGATASTVKQKLSGVVFSATLNSDPTQVWYSTTSGTDGRCVIKDLPYGVYTIREYTVPAYAYNGEFTIGTSVNRVQTFEQNIKVDKGGASVYEYSDITNVPKKMNITIEKEDIETGTTTQGDATLAGAEYTIYRDEECTDVVEVLTIQKDGAKWTATSSWFLSGTYYVKETKAPVGYNIDTTKYTVSQDPAAQTTEYIAHSITSKEEVIRNSIDITKYLEATDSTEKQPLSGIVFRATLMSDKTQHWFSTTTDADGSCVIADLPYGTYVIDESTTRDFVYDSTFTIDEGARTKTFEQFIELEEDKGNPHYEYSNVTDIAEKMQITVYKEDIETGTTTQGDAHLEGAVYGLFRDEACTDKVEEITIAKNADGTYSATSGWYLVGTYYVKELIPPVGYNIDTTVYTVAQDPAVQTTEFTSHSITSKEEVIRNSIDITKYLEVTDSTPKQSLAGAQFTATLNSDTTQHWYSTITNANGECIIKDLPYGTYTIHESKVPDTVYDAQFTIDEGDRTHTFEEFIELEEDKGNPHYVYSNVTDIAKKMQITVYKEDAEKGTKVQGDATLAGAEYTLYRDAACTDAIETITIAKNDDGTWSATSGWYLVGKYWVKETKAPEGYLIDEDVYPVEQVPAEQTAEFSSHSITSKDKVMKGYVDGYKYGKINGQTNSVPAEGAVLRLTLDSDESVYYDAVVRADGFYEFVDENVRAVDYPYTIPYGAYTISEVSASDSGEHIFIYEQATEIREQAQENYYILADEWVRLMLTIQKYDEETSKLIKTTHATFKVWDATNKCWYSEMVYPSGEIVTEFTTNNNGEIQLNEALESRAYVLYEITAPHGYYLADAMREGAKGYQFSIGVNKDGEVIATHEKEHTVLEYTTEMYQNIPTKLYHYTAPIDDMPQKAVIQITDIAEQFVKVEENKTDYGTEHTPVFEKTGLAGVEFDIVASEDVYTEDGTLRYTKGQIVEHVITNAEGKVDTKQIYLGKYDVVPTKVPNGYKLDTTPVKLNIEYTNQFEKVQYIPVNFENEKQDVDFKFKKEFEELKVSRFKFDEKSATFGIYTKETIKNANGQNTIGVDELVDVITTDKDGNVVANVELPQGKYYVKELAATIPYPVITDLFDFDVVYTNTTDKTINVTINNGKVTNTPKVVELELIAYPEDIYDEEGIADIDDRETLEDLAVEYGIADKTYEIYQDKECTKPVMTVDDEVASFTTDENGTIYIPDMPTGTYYFKEVVAPFGYEIAKEPVVAKLDGNRKLTIIKISEPLKKADLLEKRDTFTKDVVPGVTYEITNEDEEVIYTLTTDEKGKIQVPIIRLENGATYFWQEVDGPDMYVLDEEKHEFVAEYDEETCEWLTKLIKVSNDRKTKEFIMKKTDAETGDPLEGCIFTIVLLDKNGNPYVNEYGETIYLVKEGVTDENGEYVIEKAPYGTYMFTEIQAPEGYELDEDVTGLVFTIGKDSADTIIFEVTNTGDIAVYAIAGVAFICLLGIAFVVIRKVKSSKK